MQLPAPVRNLRDLSQAAGAKNALVLMLSHLLRKASPALGARMRRKVLPVRTSRCSQLLYLRPGTSDKDAFRQVFIFEEYAPCAGLENVRTIVDCGANIGLASMYLLDRYPLATVLAIEPDPANAEICRRNLRSFGSRASVETAGIWPTGDWKNPVRLRLDRTAGDRRDWAIRVREARETEDAEALGVSMPAICERVGRIDLLKMDVEGAEALIFSGAAALWLSRVGNIAIELHNDHCRQAFNDALATFTFELSRSRESVFLKNITDRAQASAA